LPWGPASGSAVAETDAEYLADDNRISGAPLNAIFESGLGNKAFQQWAAMVYALGQYMVGKGISASDANVATLVTNLTAALAAATNVNITPVTVDAVVTNPQTMMSYSLPYASWPAVGKTVRITCAGNFIPVNTTENIALEFIVNGTPVPNGGVPSIIALNFTPTSLSPGSWILRAIINVTGLPGGGLTFISTIDIKATDGAGVTFNFSASGDGDLTGPLTEITMSPAIGFSTASSSNQGIELLMLVEQMN